MTIDEIPLWIVVDRVGSLSEVMKWDLEDIDAYLAIQDWKRDMEKAWHHYNTGDNENNGRR